jgi:hypothetical protein
MRQGIAPSKQDKQDKLGRKQDSVSRTVGSGASVGSTSLEVLGVCTSSQPCQSRSSVRVLTVSKIPTVLYQGKSCNARSMLCNAAERGVYHTRWGAA